ncbi:hypothetical protein MPTK1_2g26485 [Marchantia polymorpha subsp. ruderalis]
MSKPSAGMIICRQASRQARRAARQPGVDKSAQQSAPPTLDRALLPHEYSSHSLASRSEHVRYDRSGQTRHSAILVEDGRREGWHSNFRRESFAVEGS